VVWSVIQGTMVWHEKPAEARFVKKGEAPPRRRCRSVRRPARRRRRASRRPWSSRCGT